MVSEKSFEMRRFQVHTHPEEPELAPFLSRWSRADGKYERCGSGGGGWMYNLTGQGGKTEILVQM